MTAPLVVAYGMGVDSTAVLVEFARRGIKPDKILFADTGDEKPETYDYLPTMQGFLRLHDMAPIEVVRYEPKHTRYTTLEENCLANGTLPSLAFGRKGCSQKYKVEPQNKHVARWAPAREAWARGERVTKVIGYDAGPADSRRSKLEDDKRYHYWYPLRDWGWDRERCKREILAAGLPVPPKSACFYCPATKPAELDELIERHPDLADRIIAMERVAAPKNRKIEGLWRRATKGRPATKKRPASEARPGSMTAYIEARRRLPIVEVA